MTEETKQPSTSKAPLTVKELIAKEKADQSWKREPWVGEDGYEYRRQRVQNDDGTFKVFDVRVGIAPRFKQGQ